MIEDIELKPNEGNPSPETPSPVLKAEFDALVREWRNSMGSATTDRKPDADAAYQEIIRLGRACPRPVLRLIFEEFNPPKLQWFDALEQITGENPASDHETVASKTRAWLEWGRAHGLIGNPGSGLGARHPLAETAGAFANDPGWDLMMEAIRARRAAEDIEDEDGAAA